MDYLTIKTEIVERVGVITLDHPPLNSVSKRMMVEMMRALDEFEQNDVVRAIMVKANGPDFSYGADGGDVKRALTAKQRRFRKAFPFLATAWLSVSTAALNRRSLRQRDGASAAPRRCSTPLISVLLEKAFGCTMAISTMVRSAPGA